MEKSLCSYSKTTTKKKKIIKTHNKYLAYIQKEERAGTKLVHLSKKENIFNHSSMNVSHITGYQKNK
jgi:hypothetical protein